MKTVYPVDEETYARIGKAYLICSEHPDVFGDVTMEKFCSMFVDVVPEGKDERETRMKTYASEMYRLLNKVFSYMADANLNEDLRLEIDECLCHVEGYPCPTDVEAGDE